MASLKVVSDRCDDNALKLAVVIPPRRNGEPNFGALEKALRGLYSVNPDAHDPDEVPHTLEAPMPPHDSGIGQVLAEAQFEAACSGPALNHAGGDIAE